MNKENGLVALSLLFTIVLAGCVSQSGAANGVTENGTPPAESVSMSQDDPKPLKAYADEAMLDPKLAVAQAPAKFKVKTFFNHPLRTLPIEWRLACKPDQKFSQNVNYKNGGTKE